MVIHASQEFPIKKISLALATLFATVSSLAVTPAAFAQAAPTQKCGGKAGTADTDAEEGCCGGYDGFPGCEGSPLGCGGQPLY